MYTIAHGMKIAGHCVTVVGMGDHGCCTDDEGVRVVTLARSRMRRLGGMYDRWKLHAWLRGEVRAGRVDCIEVPDFKGMLPLPFRGCPTFVRLHMSATALALNAGRKIGAETFQAERYTLKHQPRWIGVSRHVLEVTKQTFGFCPAAETVIYNPIVLPERNAGPMPALPENFVLFAGAVRERKGAYILAEAARQFLPRHPSLHLVYAGAEHTEDGMPASERIRRILGTEFLSRLHFLGRVSREVLSACMAKAAIYASPSLLEAFGLTPGEAMLNGAPVVISNMNPFNEMVKHEVTGLLVPPLPGAVRGPSPHS